MATLSLPWLKYERESSLVPPWEVVCMNQHLPMQFQHSAGQPPGAGGQDFKLDLRGG